MNGRTPQQLQATLNKKFDIVGLRQLALALNIDDENLERKTKQEFVISLIKYAERRNLTDDLWALAEKPQEAEPTRRESSFWSEMSFGTKVGIISVVVTIIGIVVTLMAIFPEVFVGGQPPEVLPTVTDKILLQIKVINGDDQTVIDNATVSLDMANELFPQRRTDSTGLAIFELPADANGQIAGITVEAAGKVETKIITVTPGMRAVEFQIGP